MIDKLSFFFVKLLAKILGFSITIADNTITFVVKSERGAKNLKTLLTKILYRLKSDLK